MAMGTYTPSTNDIIHRSSVDIVTRSFVSDPIHLVQYDQTLPILEVELWRNGVPYIAPTNAVINIRLEKPDGHVVYNPSMGLSSDKKMAYFQVTDQMTTAYGVANAIVEVVDGSKIAGTAPLMLVIDRNPVQNGAIESTEEMKSIASFVASAENSAVQAETSAQNANASKISAQSSAAQAATNAASTAINAASAEDAKDAAENYAIQAESFTQGGTGTRENEDVDNAKYYYEQIRGVSRLSGGLDPRGTIPFEELPLTGIDEGFMYNISNSFISDNRFKDGGGKRYGAGSNVYYTADGYWDVLASSGVLGVKGANEDDYREGYITITPEDVGGVTGIKGANETGSFRTGNVIITPADIGMDPDQSPVKHVNKEEYENLPDTKLTDDVVYFIDDMEPESEGGVASDIYYDNSESGLESTTVQSAIDELTEAAQNVTLNSLIKSARGFMKNQDASLGTKTFRFNLDNDTFRIPGYVPFMYCLETVLYSSMMTSLDDLAIRNLSGTLVGKTYFDFEYMVQSSPGSGTYQFNFVIFYIKEG